MFGALALGWTSGLGLPVLVVLCVPAAVASSFAGHGLGPTSRPRSMRVRWGAVSGLLIAAALLVPFLPAPSALLLGLLGGALAGAYAAWAEFRVRPTQPGDVERDNLSNVFR